ERMARVEEVLAAAARSARGPLADHAAATIAAGGKRLRPMLVFLAAGDGAPADDAGLVRVAAAVELVHSATLVHDDVLDVSGPPERTGKPRGTDLLDGTVTLPYILARERDPSLPEPRAITDADAVCDQITATGALDDVRARALEIVADAKSLLPRRDRALELVADGVVERYA